MSRRTDTLPPLSGLPHLIREIRYHEFSRQAVGILLVPVFGFLGNPLPALFWVGAVVTVLGIVVRLYASGFIMKNKELATIGPYSVVRHPLYTGNTLVLIGMAVACSQWWGAPVGVFFLWFWYPPAISYEDSKLHKLFGESWEQWSKNVPALIPRSLPSGEGGSWSLMKSLKQNYEPLVVAWVLFWLCWLWTLLAR
jgi:protein-S-isoprenylcysteine O-methyltransferase Ste14